MVELTEERVYQNPTLVAKGPDFQTLFLDTLGWALVPLHNKFTGALTHTCDNSQVTW